MILYGSYERGDYTEDSDSDIMILVDLPNEEMDHFVILFRDMADEAFNEFHNRKYFFRIGIIFAPVIMESDKVAIVLVNPGSGDHGSSEVTPNIFYHGFGITFVWFCIDIKAFLALVAAGKAADTDCAGYFSTAL